MLKVSVIGAGSFGTVLASIAAQNCQHVTWWMRNQEQVQHIKTHRVNPSYFSETKIPKNIKVTSDLNEAVEKSQLIVIAIPSANFIDVVKKIVPKLHAETVIVSATKGMESKSFQTMSQLLESELLAHAKTNHVGILSGPNLASEILAQDLTASVLASKYQDVYGRAAEVLETAYFRLYFNADVIGIELCGALKNIYAIASGLMDALEMGSNTKSMFITRSLAEMSRLCVPMGANPMTFLGLAGIGDLIATCTSSLSRNYSLGYSLGKGKSLQETLSTLNQVAEGVNTLSTVYNKSQKEHIDMPLVKGLYDIVFSNQAPASFAKALMQIHHNKDVEHPFTANSLHIV